MGCARCGRRFGSSEKCTAARSGARNAKAARRRPSISSRLRSLLRLRALAHGDAFVLEHGRELPSLEHLADDVAAADELALDVELRDRRPVGVGLDAVAQI